MPMAAGATAPDSIPLQLEVTINGSPINLIGAFERLPDGSIASTRGELNELGIAVPGEGDAEQPIALKDIPGLVYAFDEATQTIDLQVRDEDRVRANYDASLPPPFIEAQSSTGLLVNYTAFASAAQNVQIFDTDVNGGSLNLDASVFSPYGTLTQTGIIGTTTFTDANILRLDTTWSYSDEEALRTYNLGDIITGGMNWTRPVRLGGGQVQRNFGIRPDLITMPLPSLSSSAAVASTVDVFVNNVQTYSQQVAGGPFTISNLPVISGGGTARLVVTDATGKQTSTETEFFTSPELLRAGLNDYSLEAGFVRLDYGEDSFNYDSNPAGVASFRHGFTNEFTGQFHSEVSTDLINGGIGGVYSGGEYGLFALAGAASLSGDDVGFLGYASWELEFASFSLQASTWRTFGNYNDLSSLSAKHQSNDADLLSTGTATAVDQAFLGYNFPDLKASVGAGLVHITEDDGTNSFIASGNYSQSFGSLTVFANAFVDLADTKNVGGYVGFSMPFGHSMVGSAGAYVAKDSFSATAEVSKGLSSEPGSTGWRVIHGQGDTNFTTASGAYRGSKALAEAYLYQEGDRLEASASLDGSVVVAGGSVFAGNRIDDSFAIVDAGAPDVDVTFENRKTGKTGKDGKLMVPGLNAYQKNKIGIDVTQLPLTSQTSEAEALVVPRPRSGVVVDFGVKEQKATALVILNDRSGNPLPAGSNATLEGSGEQSVIGYDGQIYFTALSSHNAVTVALGQSTCRAEFSYKENPDQAQPMIGPFTCQ